MSSQLCGPQSCELWNKSCIFANEKDWFFDMKKRAFIYGVAVDGNNFTDRVAETRRLKNDFENGQNVILISNRRIGKTSLVKHVCSQVETDLVSVVNMDIYDCRSEYEFYNKFATSILKQTAQKSDMILQNIKDFLVRLSPKISFSPDTGNEISLSLGITPKEYSAEEILQLPELIAQKIGKRIVVCIDEFQQIGEFTDSITIQKKMRGIWQLQKHVSYCLFGSKKHLLSNLFQNKRMPFYQFGDTIFLNPIPTADWIPFIKSKFAEKQIVISDLLIEQLCDIVCNHSSYVQQLAWNVMLNAEKDVTKETLNEALNDMLNQNSAMFYQQIEGLSSYQINFIKALIDGVEKDFTSQKVLSEYNLGTKSNISRIVTVLTNKELIEKTTKDKIVFSDPLFPLWFKREFC